MLEIRPRLEPHTVNRKVIERVLVNGHVHPEVKSKIDHLPVQTLNGIGHKESKSSLYDSGTSTLTVHERRRVQIVRRGLQEEVSPTQTESAETKEQQFVKYAAKLSAIKAAAEGHALWQAQRDYRPASEAAVKDTAEYKSIKKQTIQALLQLDKALGSMSDEGERARAIREFRHFWGENSEMYEIMHRQVLNTLDNPSPTEQPDPSLIDVVRTKLNDGAAMIGDVINQRILRKEKQPDENPHVDSKATSILVDREIPLENKIELLTLAGYSPKQAASIAAKFGISIATTAAFKVGGDYGATIAGAIAQAHDVFRDLPIPVQLGITGATWAGYHKTAREYGKACVRSLRKTGFSLNAFASSTFHATAFRSPKTQEQATVNTVSGVEVLSDLYLGMPSLLTQDPTFFATVNTAGIALTLGQIGLTEGIRKGVELKEKFSNKSLNEAKPRIQEQNGHKNLESIATIWVNPKVKSATLST
jgi:hypothetical protein